MASTHYDRDHKLLSSGYVVPSGISVNAASAIMNDADAVVEEFATALTKKLEDDIPHSRVRRC